MWLKEIVVDGFKSYAHRTVIGPFDSAFTAITGLNGTGKSNILDAICFVLGITTLSQVRAGSLQELVYKQGQSGVSSATVTLIFDNSDPASSPAGYSDYKELTVTRQVVIGGKNKYLVNGHTAQLKRVTDLFHSVGLNVNNANFLIMQGRITKVINMKPIELLSLVEETAGTSMFENKKEAAIKTIDKKQAKLTEINQILTQEITPQLEQLRQDQASYTLYLQKQQELERKKKIVCAYNYYSTQQHIHTLQQQKQQYTNDITSTQQEQQQLIDNIQETQQKIDQLLAEVDVEAVAQLQRFEKDVNEQSKQVVKITSLYQNNQEAQQVEEQQYKSIQQQSQQQQQLLKQQQKQLQQLEQQVQKAQQEVQRVTEQIAVCRSQELGIDTTSNAADKSSATSGGLNGQLMAAQRAVTQMESEIQQKKIQWGHIKTSITEKEATMKQYNAEYNNIQKQCQRKQQEIQQIQKKLQGLSFDAEKRASLESEVSVLEEECQSLRSAVNQLAARLSRFDFQYQSPSASFDRSTVKGCVASHIQVKRDAASRAVEVSAGSRLLNVIVDNEEVGKQLLEKGELKQRVTIIPLNKIAQSSIPTEAVRAAQQLVGKDNVHTALDCIDYPNDVAAAMKYVFGATLITPTADQASKVCFHPNVAKKTVSYDGDIVDPKGTMEGGAINQSINWLTQLSTLKAQRQQLADKQHTLELKQQQLQQMNEQVTLHTTLTTHLTQCTHELSLLTQQAANTDYAYHQTALTQLKQQQQDLEQEQTRVSERRQVLLTDCSNIEQQIQSMEQERGNVMQRLQTDIHKYTTQQTTLKQAHHEKQQQYQCLQLETQAIQEELTALEQQVLASQQSISKYQQQGETLSQQVHITKQAYDQAAKRLQQEKEERLLQTSELREMQQQHKQLLRQQKAQETKVKQLQQQVTRCAHDITEAEKRIHVWNKTETWIQRDKHLFNLPNHPDYSFQTMFTSAAEANQFITDLTQQVTSLGQSLNKKALASFDRAEAEYNELTQKKSIVEADKTKIEQVISQLEMKKKIAVQETWKKVNTDFGAIMSALLPGVFCALQPIDTDNLHQGVEMKVSFHGVWKESLSELSGGQRSLLALSFILALLLYKPAPMYILDEIDSALDLSHTQNIGHMFKLQFPQSQFIIVSLKEGMFQHANVLFRTQFIQGVSTVTRTQVMNHNNNSKSSKKMMIEEEEGKEEEKQTTGKRKQNTHKHAISIVEQQEQVQNKENMRPNRRR